MTDKVIKVLKSTLEINGGKDGKEWKRRGEKLYKEWIADGWIMAMNGIPGEGEPRTILTALKKRTEKAVSEWKEEGEPLKGKSKDAMEKARLKERIGLAMLEKLKKMWEDKVPPKITNRLYPALPSAPPPYENPPKTMAPVLELTGRVQYQQKDGVLQDTWVGEEEVNRRRGDIEQMLKTARDLKEQISQLSRLDKEEEDSERSTEYRDLCRTGASERENEEIGRRSTASSTIYDNNAELRKELKVLEKQVREDRKELALTSLHRTPEPRGGHCIDLGEEEEEYEDVKQTKMLYGAFQGDIWDEEGPAQRTRAKTQGRGGNCGGQYPLRETTGGVPVYKPWPHRDVQTLVDSLPQPEESGHRWVKAFESLTAADELTIGDIVAVMNRCMGDQECKEILTQAGLRGIVGAATGFDRYRTVIWDAVRRKYPTQARPDLMRTLTLNDDETIPAYMKRAKCLWRQAWNEEPTKNTMSHLFLANCLGGLPDQARVECEKVVALTAKSIPEFTEIAQHHVERWREGKRKEEDELKQLQKKVLKKQLAEDKPGKQMVVTSTPNMQNVQSIDPVAAAAAAVVQALTGMVGPQMMAPVGPNGYWSDRMYREPDPPQQPGYAPCCFNCGEPGHMARFCLHPHQRLRKRPRGRGYGGQQEGGGPRYPGQRPTWQGAQQFQPQPAPQYPEGSNIQPQQLPNPEMLPSMSWMGMQHPNQDPQ